MSSSQLHLSITLAEDRGDSPEVDLPDKDVDHGIHCVNQSSNEVDVPDSCWTELDVEGLQHNHNLPTNKDVAFS